MYMLYVYAICICYIYKLCASILCIHTLSGRIGKVVALHAAVACSVPADVPLIYTMHGALRGYCP